MSDKIKVQPALIDESDPSKGRKMVRRPAGEGGQLMAEGGEMVPDVSYWWRRLKSADVVRVQPKAKAAAKSKSQPIATAKKES